MGSLSREDSEGNQSDNLVFGDKGSEKDRTQSEIMN
jgi:hypothetical protein